MTLLRTFIAAALVSLAACGAPQQQASTAAPSGKPGDSASAPQASAPAPSADTGKPGASAPAVESASLITPDFLAGRWGDNGDCNKDIVFNPDGTFRSYTGGEGRWQINGDTVVMSGAGGTFSLQMRLIDQNHVMLRDPNGSVGTSQRC